MKKVIEFNLWDSAYEANKEFYTKEQIDDMTLDELMELADQTDAVDDKDAIHALNKTSKMKKYKQNLRIEGNKVWSYTTHVATIKDDELHQLGWWSVTTQKHINYVASELNLTLIK